MKWGAAIVAAGSGKRLGRPKQFIELAGLPMAGWSIQTFAAMPEIARLVVATEPESIEAMRALLGRVAPNLAHEVIPGGKTRQESARECVVALAADCDAMFVHDGARPLVTQADVRAGMREVRRGRGALLAEAVVDTIKRVDAQTRLVRETLERGELWAAQTPQFAWAADLLAAHERASEERLAVTDDAALLERVGVEVAVIPASGENFKVTLAQDVARADAILRRRSRTLVAG